MIQATLCFVFQDEPHPKVLLGFKKRGFGQGKIGSFGGKPGAGESLEVAAARELYEESGLTAIPSVLSWMGMLTFIFPNKPAWDHEVHVFIANKWRGIPIDTEEMHPHWFNLAEIPYHQMWDDTRYWLPCILSRRRFRASFTFNPDNETVKDYQLQEING